MPPLISEIVSESLHLPTKGQVITGLILQVICRPTILLWSLQQTVLHLVKLQLFKAVLVKEVFAMSETKQPEDTVYSRMVTMQVVLVMLVLVIMQFLETSHNAIHR